MDEITGLYDHGARNRNPITAVWYGIDELFEKYPENGPYGYCGGDPVKFVDLDGRKLDENDAETFEHLNAIKDALYSAKVQIENERNQIQNSSELSGKDKSRLNDLNKRHKEIMRSFNRMKKVIEDPKHIFRIRTTNSKIADIKPSVDEIRTLVYVKGDMGNAIHEVIVHGSQIAWGKTWYQIINGEVIRYIKEGINEYDIEVEAYRAQYAYKGVLEGYETPDYDCSSCNYNTDEQINDFFSISSMDEISRWKVQIMQRGQIGNNLLYGKKKK